MKCGDKGRRYVKGEKSLNRRMRAFSGKLDGFWRGLTRGQRSQVSDSKVGWMEPNYILRSPDLMPLSDGLFPIRDRDCQVKKF